MKELKPRTEGLGRSIPKTESPKSRRVSQHKELAVVTLGMVAVITGVGGLLAASPPLGLASEGAPDTGNETTALVQPDPRPSDSRSSETADVESSTSAIGEPGPLRRDDEASERGVQATQAAPPPVQQPVQEESAQMPSRSSSSQAPAHAKSRGS